MQYEKKHTILSIVFIFCIVLIISSIIALGSGVFDGAFPWLDTKEEESTIPELLKEEETAPELGKRNKKRLPLQQQKKNQNYLKNIHILKEHRKN